MSPDHPDRLNADSFLNHFQQHDLIYKDDHVLVAVSGGMDSMVLLHLMTEIADVYPLTISVGHVDHHLRKDSALDREFVQRTCNKLNIPVYIKELNPEEMPKGSSVENWARTERYSALEAIRNRIQADRISTAHHENDQVETILMHLAGGCGLNGLRGIQEKRDRVIRPLLTFSRKDIEQYTKRWKLQYREDKTNKNISNPRNFIRHQFVKQWEENTPSLGRGFSRTAEHMNDLTAGLDFLIHKVTNDLVKDVSLNRLKIPIEVLGDYPEIIQAMIVKNVSEDQSVSWRQHQWEDVKCFLRTATTGQTFTLSNQWICLRDRDDWIFEKDQTPAQLEIHAVEGENIKVGDATFKWVRIQQVKDTRHDPMNEVIDGRYIQDKKLMIRPWRAGDVFIPLGMKGKKKVHDFLVDEKVDLFSKNRQYVLTADNEIIWVIGRRISDIVKITERTTEVVNLQFTKKIEGNQK